MQFLDSVFGDCGHWHIDKAVDVPVISRLALFVLFIYSGIQFGRAKTVFSISSSPLDDDDEGLGDDDDLLELRAADEKSKMEKVSDRVFWRF